MVQVKSCSPEEVAARVRDKRCGLCDKRLEDGHEEDCPVLALKGILESQAEDPNGWGLDAPRALGLALTPLTNKE